MGRGASDIDPAGKADVTGAYAPAVREVRRVQAAVLDLPLFSLPVSLQTLLKCGYNRYRNIGYAVLTKELNCMLTNERVLKIFADYLEKDQALEIVPTRHGYAVMLWDKAGQDWSEVTCCPTPEDLFDKLLDAATGYQEYLILRKAEMDDLDDKGRQKVEQVRQEYLKQKER